LQPVSYPLRAGWYGMASIDGFPLPSAFTFARYQVEPLYFIPPPRANSTDRGTTMPIQQARLPHMWGSLTDRALYMQVRKSGKNPSCHQLKDEYNVSGSKEARLCSYETV
jgi:hypothetical protein